MSSDQPLASLYYSPSPTKTFGISNKIQVSHKWKGTTREELNSFWASEGCGKQTQSVQFTINIIQPLFTKAMSKAKHVLITRKNTWNCFKLMKSYFTTSFTHFYMCFLANRALGNLCVKKRENLGRSYLLMFFYFKTFKMKSEWDVASSLLQFLQLHMFKDFFNSDIPSTSTHFVRNVCFHLSNQLNSQFTWLIDHK